MENTETTVHSREERKKLKEQVTSEIKIEKQEDEKTRNVRKRKPKKMRVRLIPIWLRVIIVLVLIVVFFMVGAMIGYGIIGDGKPTDVLNKETWTHILEIIDSDADSK